RAQSPALPDGTTPVPTAPANSNAGANEVADITFNLTSTDMNQALEIYSEKLVGRTILRVGPIPGTFVLKTQTPLTKREAIEAFEAVFAMNGISIVNIGDKFMKVVPSADAGGAG